MVKIKITNIVWVMTAFVGSVLLTACSNSENTEVMVETTDFHAAYQIAVEDAVAWNDDAYMHSASVPIYLAGAKPNLLATFSFYSTEDRSKWLYITFDSLETGEVITERNVRDFEIERPPPNPLLDIDQVMASSDAMKRINEGGAREFIHEYGISELSHMSLRYSEPFYEQGPLIWSGILYASNESKSIRIEIDAQSGDLIEEPHINQTR